MVFCITEVLNIPEIPYVPSRPVPPQKMDSFFKPLTLQVCVWKSDGLQLIQVTNPLILLLSSTLYIIEKGKIHY